MKAKTRIENRYEDVEIPSVRQLLWLLLWCSIWEKVLPWTCYELILLNKYGCFASVLEIEDREGLNLKSSVHCFSKSSLIFFQEV
jgi:hypothetical protein